MEKVFHYKPVGVCSREFTITYDGDTITKVIITGGCPGNTQGLSSLLRGMKISEAISRIKGIQCRNGTSCPDQMSKALEEIEKSIDSAN